MNKQKLLKFAKMLHAFAELHTKEGVLISDAEIVVGSEVFVANENGDMVTPTDGEYNTEGECYVVVGGIVTEVKMVEAEPIVEPEPEPVQEPVQEPCLDTETEELKAELAKVKYENEQLKNRIKELEEQLKEPVAEPITMPVITEKLSALSVAFKR